MRSCPCCNSYKRCITKNRNKIVRLSENNKTAIFNNPYECIIEQGIVDNCVITTGKRCDFFIQSSGKIWYVELKGRDIDVAIQQIQNTIDACSHCHSKHERFGVIVAAKCPAANSSAMKSLKRQKDAGKLKFKPILKSLKYETIVS